MWRKVGKGSLNRLESTRNPDVLKMIKALEKAVDCVLTVARVSIEV